MDNWTGRTQPKFKREALLNYVMNRWGLNKAQSVGSTSELIRKCAPEQFDAWEQYYFAHATQKKKDGIRITRDFIQGLGQKLYIKLTEVVHNELESFKRKSVLTMHTILFEIELMKDTDQK